MYACMCVCMYARIHLCMHSCMHVHKYVCMYVLSPQDRTPVLTGAALDVKPGDRTIIMPLTVWAALP
jgi:hypothetical protein